MDDPERSAAWLRELAWDEPRLYPWFAAFLRVYERVDEAQRDQMRAVLAALDKELLIAQALRSSARRN